MEKEFRDSLIPNPRGWALVAIPVVPLVTMPLIKDISTLILWLLLLISWTATVLVCSACRSMILQIRHQKDRADVAEEQLAALRPKIQVYEKRYGKVKRT